MSFKIMTQMVTHVFVVVDLTPQVTREDFMGRPQVVGTHAVVNGVFMSRREADQRVSELSVSRETSTFQVFRQVLQVPESVSVALMVGTGR